MAALLEYTGHIINRDMVIADSATTSTTPIDCGRYRLTGVTLPSGYDGVTLKFTVSDTYSGTYNTLHDGSADVSLTVAASRYIGFKQDVAEYFKGIRYFNVTTPSQTGAVTLTFHLVPSTDTGR